MKILKTILHAAIALSASCLILFSAWLLLTSPIFPQHQINITNWRGLPNNHNTSSAEWIFYPIEPAGEAIWAQLPFILNATNYHIITAHIEGRTTQTQAIILWRTQARPNVINKYPLPWPASSASTFNLNTVRQWTGNILNFGIAIGGQASTPVRVHSVTIQSLSALGQLQLLWTAATSFEGFRAYSINFIYGGLTLYTTISGTLIIATWISLASLLSLISQLIRRFTRKNVPTSFRRKLMSFRRKLMSFRRKLTSFRRKPESKLDTGFRRCDEVISGNRLITNKLHLATFATILLIGWLILDMRWQLELMRQRELTIREYAGLTPEARRLNGKDGTLFRLITAAKNLMPKTPQRILLIPNTEDINNAKLSRASFYLRPHNVYTADMTPLCQSKLQPGDYIFSIGTPAKLLYRDQRLSWEGCNVLLGEKQFLIAKRILATAVGQLFFIIPEFRSTPE